jgi:integrase
MSNPARVLAEGDVHRVLRHVSLLRYPNRNRVVVLLSFKAGLRACEIAGLRWEMLLRPDGRIDNLLHISGSISKNGNPRRVPIHPELKQALRNLRRSHNNPDQGAVIASERGGHMSAGSIVNWFSNQYAELGMAGCSSHSGRRTFITRSARLLPKTGGSLRDIQELVGHRDLGTTQRYIEGDRDAQRKLVRLI